MSRGLPPAGAWPRPYPRTALRSVPVNDRTSTHTDPQARIRSTKRILPRPPPSAIRDVWMHDPRVRGSQAGPPPARMYSDAAVGLRTHSPRAARKSS